MFAGMKTGPLFIPLPSAPPGSVLPSPQGKTLVSSAQVLLPFTWIPGSCIYCHVLSCAHVCMHIRSHQEGSKNTPVHKHVCVLRCSKNEARNKERVLDHYRNRVNATPVFKKKTHLQIQHAVAAAGCFFVRPHLSWQCVWPQRSTKVRARKSL